jgi:hypothetical protein
MRRMRGSSRVAIVAVLVPVAVAAVLPGGARATYVGLEEVTVLGTVAAGGGWIAVPQYEDKFDPGTIDGSPSDKTTSSLELARVVGRRQISFRTASPSTSGTMGPMLVAGATSGLAVAWTDVAGAGQVDTTTLGAGGHLSTPVAQLTAADRGSLRLTSAPDGTFVVSWHTAAGEQAVATPAGLSATPLLAPSVALDPAAHIVLSGGNSFWLVVTNGADLSLAPAVFGQDSASSTVTTTGARDATTLGDGAGGLWVLARRTGRWFAAHLDHAGEEHTALLPAAATRAVIGLAGTTAVVAYRSGVHCADHIERITEDGASTSPTRILPQTRGCSSPTWVTADPSTGTAYVLLHQRHGTTLATESTTGETSSWRGSLRERVDALVPAGSNRVVLESNGPTRSLGEQCGGAAPSTAQAYAFRVFQGPRLQRIGYLAASDFNC